MKTADLKSTVQLQPQQEDVIKKIKQEPAVLVYHGLGSGKTLASIASGETLGGRKQVVVPASLRENYRKELRKFVSGRPRGYDIMSYNKAVKHGLKPADLTVFDEAHRMGRAESQASKLPERVPGKALFLTGTPVRNTPEELLPLLKKLAPDRNIPGSPKAFKENFVAQKSVSPGILARLMGVTPGVTEELKNTSTLRRMLKGRVSYHASEGEFPRVTTRDVPVEMSKEQTSLYHGLMAANPVLAYKVKHNLPPNKTESKALNAFLTGARQVSNNPMLYDKSLTGSAISHSPKLKRAFTDAMLRLKKDPTFKTMIYSNYLDAGIMPLAEQFQRAGIPYAVFYGYEEDVVTVYCVFHTARDPSKWRERLP